jgi:hypothetical protein
LAASYRGHPISDLGNRLAFYLVDDYSAAGLKAHEMDGLRLTEYHCERPQILGKASPSEWFSE